MFLFVLHSIACLETRLTRTYFVQTAPYVDGRLLNDIVDNDRKRGQEVGGVDLGIEEYLGSQEALVANIKCVALKA
jgi:hypothetical protein